LKEFLGVKEEPIAMFLDTWAYTSLAGFAATILFGIVFHYASAKWVKQAHGQPVRVVGRHLEGLLDWCFALTAVSFAIGIACFVEFALSS
jgi:hypothetical protein